MASPELTLPSVKKFGRDRIHAATQKEPSASTSSSLEGVFDKMTTEQQQIGSPTFDGCEQRKWYNLGNLTGSSQTATHGASGSVCKEYLSTLFSGYTCDKVMVEVFQILPPFICNARQFLDVCVYEWGKEIPLLLVEVHSSSYAHTIRKCAISVIDQLHLHRMAKPNITSCIGFAFPKLPQNDTHSYKQSVVQVKISWDMKKLCFIYDLQPLVLAEVKTALEQALRMNESQQLEYQDNMNEMYVA